MTPETAPGVPMLRMAVAFGRLLRRAGLAAGPDRVVGFASALEELDVGSRDDVYWAGRTTLCSRPEDFEMYERVFRVFWEGREGLKVPDPPGAKFSIQLSPDSVQPPKKSAEENEKGDEAVKLRYSPVDVLRRKDFADCTPEEFAELYRLMADMSLSGAMKRSRRLEPAHRGRHDQRRTLRGAMRTGGEPMRHRYRKARDRPRRVVLLCDVSGSMASYSRALLRFMHAGVASGVASGGPVEAFVMGTRLTRITRELTTRSPDRALREASKSIEDWSGGTRLGDTVKEFVDVWGQRGMARGAVVVLLSDGWDRGDVGVLADAMRRIHRLAHSVIWVNPLKAAPGYQPLARGMAAALPHVDVFLSGHNFEDLQELSYAVAGASRGGG
ncbi:MAG: Carbon monoxide oxidation accessory protein CoxE [uncultured Rubrobacteraceae bacterium]|uniref:Carbon monoxide oxidation accessory protein CoxE n=1 Tax=uncultured Rubrobacteraceae bacterium TaxID=349277 RepID=A0A6J4PD35_9ACTN|nr:MAG: Carbon monoxide oxidation accessory protein CoxE [uncultured Rubrobacteraceae bacterium]